MSLEESDRMALQHILETSPHPVLACYRTGSTVSGEAEPHSDIDYLVITGNADHSLYKYADRKKDDVSGKRVDFVYLTRRDMESPLTIPEEQGRDDKIMYLMRELGRERILLHGVDAFLALLNEEELREVAEQLGIDSGSMARDKNAVLWE